MRVHSKQLNDRFCRSLVLYCAWNHVGDVGSLEFAISVKLKPLVYVLMNVGTTERCVRCIYEVRRWSVPVIRLKKTLSQECPLGECKEIMFLGFIILILDDTAVNGKVQKDVDQFISAAVGLRSQFLQLSDGFFFDPYGKHSIAILSLIFLGMKDQIIMRHSITPFKHILWLNPVIWYVIICVI